MRIVVIFAATIALLFAIIARSRGRGFVRWWLCSFVVVFFIGSIGFVFFTAYKLRDAVTFFHTPKEMAENNIPAGKRIRLGGLVAEGSVKRSAGTTVEFVITDTLRTIAVGYTGILPDLFREGQGVVAEGKLDAAGRFLAETLLVKHDETYMPPEVAGALKAQGLWKGAGKAPGGHVAK